MTKGVAQALSRSSNIRQTLNELSDRFGALFEAAAPSMFGPMLDGVQKGTDQKFKNLGIGAPDDSVQIFYRQAATENAALIKSIPAEHVDKIRKAVEDSISGQGSFNDILDRLKEVNGMTDRRAKLIALDQTRKTYQGAAINRAVAAAGGVSGTQPVRAIWVHSHAGGGDKQPRRRHLDYHGKEFDLRKGAPVGDNGGNYVQPSEEVNCRCTFRLILDFGTSPDASQ